MANPTGKGGWKQGRSGNPNGRPPKARALTALLETALSRSVEIPERGKIARKRLLAEMVSEVATTGQVTLPTGEIKKIVDFADWWAVVQFIYKHIDGPPPAKLEGAGENGAIEIRVVRVPARSDDDVNDL